VAADTGRFPEITWETVVLLTPAAFATAWMFGADSDELDRKLVCSFTIEFSQHGGKGLIRWGELNTNRFAREVECMPYGLAAQVVNYPVPALYAIRIKGQLGATALSAFPAMVPRQQGHDTALTGLLDQSALFGVLAGVEALGLGLLEVRQLTRHRKSPE
jgi:hypothetical protein